MFLINLTQFTVNSGAWLSRWEILICNKVFRIKLNLAEFLFFVSVMGRVVKVG